MEPFPWFFDELAHAGSEHLDPEYVATYDRKAGADPGDDLVLLRDLGLNTRSVLVDLGAGTGSFALAAAPLCRRVIAADVSTPMLGVLQKRTEEAGLENIECVRAGFLSYRHDGEPADFVYSRNALHHLPDFWKAIALNRITAILRPGGVLRLRDLVFAFDPSETEHFVTPWLSQAAESPEVGWTREEYEEHLRDEYSTFNWLLEPMLERAGFEIQSAEYSASRIYAAYTCVKR